MNAKETKTISNVNLQALCTTLIHQNRMIIGLDTDLSINVFNPAAEQYLGLTAAECLGKPYSILSKYFELDNLTKLLTKKSKKTFTKHNNILTKLVNPSSTIKYFTWSLEEVIDENKVRLGFLLLEEAEHYSTEQKSALYCLTKFANNLPGSLYFKDINGKYLWVNDYVVKMAGKKSVLDIIGKDDYDFCWKKIADKWRKNDQEVIKSRRSKTLEEPGVLANGNEILMLCTKIPVFDKNKKVIGIMGNSIDISDRKKFENTLQEKSKSQEEVLYYLTNFANSLPGSLYFKDKNSKYLWVNDYVVKMAGKKSVLDIVGKDDYAFCWKNLAKPWIENDQEIMQSKSPKVVEETILLADGTTQSMLSSKTPIFNKNDEVIGIMGNSLDITDRKKAEEQLKEAKEKAEEVSKIKSQFIRNMEHDLRTPFSGLYGMSKYLFDEETDEFKKEILGDIAQSAKELLDYCTSILDFSKIEHGDLPLLNKKFNLYDLANRVVSMELPAAKHKGLELTLDYDKNTPQFLIGDDHRLLRLLMNLISNAIKFTQSGYIKVSIKKIGALDKKNIIIQFIVEDTGIGIPQDKINFIYEKFSRGTESNKGIYKGLGLGLRVVKQFIEEMNGEIEVLSELSNGTKIICTIPFKLPLLGDSMIST